MRFRVQGLDHVALGVQDQASLATWYREVLGLEREHEADWGDTPIVVAAQGSGLALFPAVGDQPSDRLRHIAFRVDRKNFELALADLSEAGIAYEVQDHGAAHSIYFRDPQGLQLELTTYEVVADAGS